MALVMVFLNVMCNFMTECDKPIMPNLNFVLIVGQKSKIPQMAVFFSQVGNLVLWVFLNSNSNTKISIKNNSKIISHL